MTELSILVPSRNEMFIGRTVADVLAHREADTEVIVVMDGPAQSPSEIPISLDPRVRVIDLAEPIGQRAATNLAAVESEARFVMKCDAHCSFEQGFDRKLMEPYQSGELGHDVTTIPRMYNLHAFDWLCQDCGWRQYQGPRPAKCGKCESERIEMDVVWQPRWSRKSDFARFDTDLHFQYHSVYSKRSEAQGDIVDLIESCGSFLDDGAGAVLGTGRLR